MSTLSEPAKVDRDSGQQPEHTLVVSPRWRLLALLLLGIVALILWRSSLVHVDVSNLNDYGLPPALPVTWYVGLALAVIGAVTAITIRCTSGLLMVAYVILVAIVLYGTVPVLSAQPHYAWVYKHIGVVRYLEAHGKVNTKIDIYNRWPGFFALGAVYSHDSGSPNPEMYANWAECAFLLLDVVLVMAVIKALARDIRVAAGAGLFFIVTNWVGQTYYSPQAFAYVLGLALILIAVRHLRVGSSYSGWITKLIERFGRVTQLPLQMDRTAKWPAWVAITAVLSLNAVIVASHQLTPYMLLASMAFLMLTGIVRPWWVLFAMALTAFAYLLPNLSFIQRNYGLFTSIDPFNNLHVARYTETPAAGVAFATHNELLLIACLFLGALCATIRLLRRGLLIRALPVVVLALSPFAVVFGQNYGGEASLRVILFSSPWCAALISWGLATVDRRRLKWGLTTIGAIVCTTFFVPSFLGAEELNIISAAEVNASEWFYYHARPRSVLVLAAPGFPYKYGGTYNEFKGPEGDADPNLLSNPVFQRRQLGAADVRRVIYRIEEYSRSGYIAFAKDETAFAQTLKITPQGALAHLEAAIARSPHFRLWYSNKDVQIYQLVESSQPSQITTASNSANARTTIHPIEPEAPAGRYVFVWGIPHAASPRRSPHPRLPTETPRAKIRKRSP